MIIVLPKNYILHEKWKKLTFSRFEAFLCCLKPFWAVWSLFGKMAIKEFLTKCSKMLWQPQDFIWKQTNVVKKPGSHWIAIIVLPKNYILRENLKKISFFTFSKAFEALKVRFSLLNSKEMRSISKNWNFFVGTWYIDKPF